MTPSTKAEDECRHANAEVVDCNLWCPECGALGHFDKKHTYEVEDATWEIPTRIASALLKARAEAWERGRIAGSIFTKAESNPYLDAKS